MNMDFNHGANLPATDMRAADISDRINAHVDAAFLALNANTPRRNYVGASGIGNDCLRAVQLQYIGAKPDPGRMGGKTLRIFDIGHKFEDVVVDWMRKAGFALEVVDPDTGEQFGFEAMDGKIKGHVDGKIWKGPIPMAFPALWECKTMNEKAWQDTKKRGMAIAKPVYAAQVAVYQAYMGLHESPALFTALNKNTGELLHELVPFDQKLAQEMSDRMVRIVTETEAQRMIPRPFSDPENFRCKHLCDFPGTCWKMSK